MTLDRTQYLVQWLIVNGPTHRRLATGQSVATRLHSAYWNGGGWGIFWTDAVRMMSCMSSLSEQATADLRVRGAE